MSRRASLPGADELFRATNPERSRQGRARAEPPAPPTPTGSAATATGTGAADDQAAAGTDGHELERHAVTSRRARAVDRRSTGRERHDEKITVYCSAEELIDLERSRLALRGDFGIAVDRGRIVREAISLVLEELEANGAASALVRRLHGT